MFNDFGQHAVPFRGLGDQRVDLGWRSAQVPRAVDARLEGATGGGLSQD